VHDRAHQAEREAAWFRHRAELAELHAAGLIHFEPVDRSEPEKRCRVVPDWPQGGHWEPDTARAHAAASTPGEWLRNGAGFDAASRTSRTQRSDVPV
jgi:hypothetical protein